MDKILIIDTEGKSNLVPYEISYIIIDKQGRLYKRAQYYLPHEASIHLKLASDQYGKGYINPKIIKGLNNYNTNVKYGTIATITGDIISDLKHYSINTVSGYNVSEDIKRLTRYDTILTDYFKLYNIAVIDTMRLAICSILPNNNYYQYCIDNGHITDNDNPRYNLQVVYNYLHNTDMVQIHDSLCDCIMTADILIRCIALNKYSLEYDYYKLLTNNNKRLYEEFKIFKEKVSVLK